MIKVAVSGNLLAILNEASLAASNTVTLADISNPAAPVLKSTIVNGVNGMTNLDNLRGSHCPETCWFWAERTV